MRKCRIKECNRKHSALGYCHAHYTRYWKGARISGPIKNHDSTQGCLIEGCNKKHESLGFCRTHSKLPVRQEIKRQLVVEFDEQCADCRGRFPDYVFDFDHIPGVKKSYGIANLITRRVSWETLAAEVAKCEMVCANCHRIRTQERIEAQ